MPTTTPFNNLITFSRGSNATVTGSNGLIQWAPNNLLTFSEQFDNAAWAKLNATVMANTAVAPDGTTTADTLTTSGTAAAQRLGQNPTNTGVSTFSIYVKAGTAQFVQLIHSSDGNAFANFDVGSGTLGTRGTGSSSAITDVGNGWYRCTLTFNIASSTFWYAYIVPSASAAYGASFTATVASVLLWGAQLEIGSTATTYNSTTVKNLLGFSEAFDNAAWTKSRASIVTGAQANPINGLFNAQKLMEDTTASNSHAASQSFTTIVGTSYTFSAYIKAAGRTFAAVYLSGPNRGIYINLTTGAYAGDLIAAPTSYRIDAIGSGWYRVSVTATAVGTTTNAFIYTANSTPDYVYTGDGNSGVYIYGAQLSDSASLDPYVPTPGAAPSSTAFYGPRFDFDPVTLQPRGLLVEEQRANLLLRSEEFGNVYWSPTGVTVTSNSIASPDGAITADTLVEDTSTGVHRVFATPSCSASTTYTFSAYVKAAGRTQVRLLETTLGGAFFDLSAVTVITTDPGVTASIANVGNGWFRCRVTSTTGGAQTLYVAQIQGSVAANNTYTGNGAAALYVWGAQLEAGAFATSYIPTVASTVTRSADVATITGQNFAQWFAGTNGSVLAEFSPLIVPAAGSRVFSINDGTSSNRMLGTPSLTSHFLVTAGGVGQADLDGGTPTAGAINKTAAAYALNDFALSLNAGATVTDTSGTVPAVSSFNLGSENGSSQLNGHIRRISFIPARAADFQLQGLST